MPVSSLNDFLKDPDQPARRAELATFFGPLPDKFLKVYDSMAAVANRPAGVRPRVSLFEGGFCWPAFFLGPIWMFYRKMWLYASIVLAIFLIFTFLPIPSGAGIGLGVAMAIAGARLYVTYAIRQATKLRADPARLAAAGGVSLPAGLVAGVLYVLIVGYLAIHMAIAERSNGTLGGPVGTYSTPR